jgi:hypothetical protein
MSITGKSASNSGKFVRESDLKFLTYWDEFG